MVNEKAKNLYAEAVTHAFDQRFVASPDGPRELQDVINEKFFELIVKECSNICDDGDGSCSSMAEMKWKNYCRDLILKHFGVK